MIRLIVLILLATGSGMLLQKFMTTGDEFQLISAICGFSISLINVVVIAKTEGLGTL